jgi:class 3 adenylate cyclase
MTPGHGLAPRATGLPAGGSPYVDDYERRRRQAETANERVVSLIIAALTGSTLLVQMIWNLEFPFVPVPERVKLVALAMLAAHVAVVAAISRQRRYSPLRKYVIVVVRMALLGCLCWAEWRHSLPEYGLIRPTSLFAVTIVLTALSYSRAAVVLAGALACVVYPAISLLGPVWPANLHASIFAVQLFIAVTVAAYRLVSQMRTMSDESVSNERLSRFFSPELASAIAYEPEIALRSAACRVTVLFSDISGFTAMSSRMPPEEVVGLLNAYFPRMVEIVFRHGGTLEKFVGDALLAVWGAPVESHDDVDRAVAAAVEMQEAVTGFNLEQQAAGRPTIAIHVGIASGSAAAGYLGTDRYVQYAVIGDTTNVAARICSAAGPGEILVSDATRRGHSGRAAAFADVPAITAKGKDGPVTLHRVLPTASR